MSVCVSERERERFRVSDRETDRECGQGSQRDQRDSGSERAGFKSCCFFLHEAPWWMMEQKWNSIKLSPPLH